MKHLILIVSALVGLATTYGVYRLGLRDRRPVLVCLGDSLTSCGGPGGHYSDWLTELMPDVRVVDAGIGGDTLDGGRRRYARDVLARKPEVLLIALGANDFWRNARQVAEMREDLEYMVKEARARKMQVVVASCFGARDYWEEVCSEFEFWRFKLAERIARMEREVCEREKCYYIPNMQPDVKPNRLPPYWDETDHPNKAGNREVALGMLPTLRLAVMNSTKVKR